MAPLEVRLNGNWHEVVGIGKAHKASGEYADGVARILPPFYVLDNGMTVHPQALNLEIKGTIDNTIFLANRDGTPKTKDVK